MGVLDDLAAHDWRDRERDLALTTAERVRDETKEALTTEQLAHADTRSTLEQRDLDLAAVTAERDLLADRVAFCDANHGTPEPTGPTKAELRAAYGVCVHATFVSKPYWADTARWMGELNKMGVTQIRGLFSQTNAGAVRCLAECRRYGIKWLMTLVPEDWSVTPAQAFAKIKWLADNGWADVVLGFEGVNEPDHERGGGAPPADWPQRTLDTQKAIFEAARLHLPDVPVLSPSLHDVNQDNLNGAGFKAIADLGIAQYVDVIALHSYPKGQDVLTGATERIARADIAFAGKPVWMTETGWTTYVKSGTGGHAATTESDAATYGKEMPATIAAHPRIKKGFRFEALDDPPGGISNNSESRFGLLRPDWSWKPEAHAVQSVLTG